MSKPSVLVVEDNDLERQITADTLREEGFLVDEAPNGMRAMEQLALGSFDVVLTDLMMPGMQGEELLAAVRQTYPGSQVVLLTAHGTIESAVKATKSGAFEYLTKPTDREKLVMTVGKAAEFASLTQENILLRTRLEGKFQVEGIIGQHPAIEDVIRVVRKVAPSYSTVLIQGESGTGKEVIARASCAAWAATNRSGSTCAWSPPPTATSPRKSPRDAFAKTSTTASTSSPSRCRRCAIAARTSRCWLRTRSRTVSPIWRKIGSKRSAAKRWKCCSTILGRATCVSSNRRSNARCCSAKATTLSPTPR